MGIDAPYGNSGFESGTPMGSERYGISFDDYAAHTARMRAQQTDFTPVQDRPPFIFIPDGGRHRPLGSELQDLGREVNVDISDAQRLSVIQDMKNGTWSPETIKLFQQIIDAPAQTRQEGHAVELLQLVLNGIARGGAEMAAQLGEPFRTMAVKIDERTGEGGVRRYILRATDGISLRETDLGPFGQRI